jgi:hypothetical protein
VEGDEFEEGVYGRWGGYGCENLVVRLKVQ